MISEFGHCAFSDRPGEMTFASFDAVYRLTGDSLVKMLDGVSTQQVVVNRRGTVAVRDGPNHLLRRAVDGPPEELAVPAPTEVGSGSEIGIADDDTIVAGVYLPGDIFNSRAIISSGTAGTRIIANGADSTLPGGPYDVLSRVRVHGTLSSMMARSG